MYTYGLIVEGVYDKEILEEFILRCANNEIARSDMGIETRICGGGSKVLKQFPGFLKEFQFNHPEIRKVFVVRDSDGKNLNELERQFREKITGWEFPFQVEFSFVIHEVEAWLLFDEAVLSRITGRKVQKIHSPLELQDPKTKLVQILSAGKIDYTPALARQIVSAMDLDILKSGTEVFRKFFSAIQSY
ncbi:MAG: Hypothetical protein C75L2_00270002 [Leptospirillum sp. Group II 'C75']|jgi:hypothetical protein|uniref:DUF4276 family protein n=2 Tax=Leptospirillum TaxID=179 RepID=A0A2I2MIS7_9BACT|nr:MULTISPECIES: DUF4276 family protein [Leptospirillum]AKS24289.1 hypothetical protein ABH19_11835 [Leptospirillum sp. Group II 'CF-1']EDZ40224.1 MAG: Hypothetical protein CGL2_11346003 [Leptospirillum sp. Group II '5-way CG']EIJ76210.1 MAG: Hypothetical protein C75L2_00270002 [Leptospirillum sp. Group II 'C75']